MGRRCAAIRGNATLPRATRVDQLTLICNSNFAQNQRHAATHENCCSSALSCPENLKLHDYPNNHDSLLFRRIEAHLSTISPYKTNLDLVAVNDPLKLVRRFIQNPGVAVLCEIPAKTAAVWASGGDDKP